MIVRPFNPHSHQLKLVLDVIPSLCRRHGGVAAVCAGQGCSTMTICFAFASKKEAEAAGFSSQSDRVNTLDAGAQLNLKNQSSVGPGEAAGINDNHHNRW